MPSLTLSEGLFFGIVIFIKVLNKNLVVKLLENNELYVVKYPKFLSLHKTLWSNVVPLLQWPKINIGSFLRV